MQSQDLLFLSLMVDLIVVVGISASFVVGIKDKDNPLFGKLLTLVFDESNCVTPMYNLIVYHISCSSDVGLPTNYTNKGVLVMGR